MVNYSKGGHVNSLLEKLFVPTSKRFNNIDQAIRWAMSKAGTNPITM